MQSRLLDASDRNAYFLFGDGAGAAIISAGTTGHRIRHVQIGGDSRGIHMARREAPGYLLPNGHGDPWIRIDGHALFRFATESFSTLIRQSVAESGWKPEDTRWVIPHQANGRILKAAAKRSGIPFDRFFVNVENVGNTSSASIPLALTDVQRSLRPDDKLVLCSVGGRADHGRDLGGVVMLRVDTTGLQSVNLVEKRDPATAGPAPAERMFDHYRGASSKCSPFFPLAGRTAFGRATGKRKKRRRAREGTFLVVKRPLHWGRPSGGELNRQTACQRHLTPYRPTP